jgi:branched-chain amino acid transport system substrate-binding protein
MSTTTSTARRAAGMALFAFALALTACGSPAPSDALPVTPTAAASAALGPVQRATKDPVAVGFMGIGLSDDTSDSTLAATAVAGYANAYLGGLAGHSIKVVPCEDHGTPAGSQACGDLFVRQGVVAVAIGTSSQLDSALPPLHNAGIPLVLNLSGTDAALHTPGIFLLRNPLSVFGTAAAYARDKKFGSTTVVTPDVPAAAAPARQLGPPLFANAGGSASVLAVGLDVQDMSPQIENAERNHPDMYLVVGDVNFCTAAITAIHKLGSKAQVVTLDQCIGADQGAAIPGGLAGVAVLAQAVLDPTNPETALFTAVRTTYGEGVGSGAQSVGGYQAMLSLVRAVNASPPADLTPASVAAALGHSTNTLYPLGGGSTFTCDGRAAPQISPNICSSSGFVATASADGTLSDYQPVDTDGIYKLG